MVVAAKGHGDYLPVVADVGFELLAYPFLQDVAFDEFPFDVEIIAHGAGGMGGLPCAGTGAEGDVGEVEEAVVVGSEEVELGVGGGVDEGDACADGFELVVEVGKVAKLCGGGSHGIPHRGHADDDKVDVALAVGGDESAVEGEVSRVVGVAYKGLQGNGFELVDEGGFEGGVGLLREGLEDLG